MINFNAKDVKDSCIDWIRIWFENNGFNCNAVIGISGGKDSSVTAALCVKALGRERVIGVLMPNGEQPDIASAINLVDYLEINNFTINIESAVRAIQLKMEYNQIEITRQTLINLPARIRMSVLYAVAQSCNGRVINTCNLSEDWVGYSTRYGDSAGDMSPLGGMTVNEVKAVGRELKLPDRFIDKVPTDGLSGKTDEENLGFTYDELDRYIRTGIIDDNDKKNRIDQLHQTNKFKLELMPVFKF